MRAEGRKKRKEAEVKCGEHTNTNNHVRLKKDSTEFQR